MIVSEPMVTALATAAFPTFAVVASIRINNRRLKHFSRSVDQRFDETNRHIDDVKEVLRSDMYRIAERLGRPATPR